MSEHRVPTRALGLMMTSPERVERGDYDCHVVVVRGEHKGRVGYCDDQEERKAIVYFSRLFLDGWHTVPYSYLRYATPEEAAQYDAKYASFLTPGQRQALGVSAGRINDPAKGEA